MTRMILQPGFAALAIYLAWVVAQVTLIILFLGALLSREYIWHSQYVGLGVLSVAIGAALAIPLSKASFFSRARVTPPRSDSMTLTTPSSSSGGGLKGFHWTSHLLRRILFTFTLPLAAACFAATAAGHPIPAIVPILACGAVGFLTNLAVAEVVGIVMEAFDTSDLQPGVNSRHRVESLPTVVKRRRTNYSSFPRVCAGVFLAQGVGWCFAAAATAVSGTVTRAIGARKAVGITAGVLFFFTVLFAAVMVRFRRVRVVPDQAWGEEVFRRESLRNDPQGEMDWRPVVVGNPSGKERRVNLLEMGQWTRWSEIRRLNRLL
ncbi:hypothetical protein K470DRAFT_259989, partial [Piedraia hortae CBS 480.64]